jgi:hypothetical protein
VLHFVGQKDQDRWVVEDVFGEKRGGWFLDLAATDGIYGNNTVVLERELGWTGLCIEPNPTDFPRLVLNRTCRKSNACVDEFAGDVEFLPNGGLGGIIADDTDNCNSIRQKLLDESYSAGKVLKLKTVSLASVLTMYQAPPIIDYFSFDVEGAETRILRSFPFDRWTFLSMTIERPTPEINNRLFSNGYVFVRNFKYDSFYVHESLQNIGQLKLEPFEQIPPKDW